MSVKLWFYYHSLHIEYLPFTFSSFLASWQGHLIFPVSGFSGNVYSSCTYLVIMSIKDFQMQAWERRPIWYRNQSIDLLRKSMDWFLYDIGLRQERVKIFISEYSSLNISKKIWKKNTWKKVKAFLFNISHEFPCFTTCNLFKY